MKRGAAHICTFTELGGKSTIDTIGRAYNVPLDVVARYKKMYDETGSMEGIINEDDRFSIYSVIDGSVVASGVHACGMAAYDGDLSSEVGTGYNRTAQRYVTQNDMKAVDSKNYVKYDILSLGTLQIASDTHKMLGQKYEYEVDWENKEVFDDLIVSPVGLFQFESDSAFEYLKRFKPTTLDEISALSAVLRPGASSFRESYINREFHHNVNERIDEILKDTLGRMVYQEQQLDFLKQLCGFSGSEADTVRRAIGKKDEKLMKTMLVKIKEGYIKNSSESKEVAEKEIEEFLEIFVDATQYSFNRSHSLSYAMMTFKAATLRLYHPVEFIASYLNNASNDGDIKAGTELAKIKGIKIEKPKFGMSGPDYTIKDGVIYKGIGSVVNVSSKAAEGLLEAYEEGYESFRDMLDKAMKKKDVNKTKIETLIRIDFFSEFGKAKKLFRYFEAYRKYKGKKTLKKDKVTTGIEKIVKMNLKKGVEGFSETAKMYKFDDTVLLDSIWNAIRDTDYDELDKIVHQLSFLNYVQDAELRNRRIGVVEFVSPKGYVLMNMLNGDNVWYGYDRDIMDIAVGDCVNVLAENDNHGRKSFVSVQKLALLRNRR